MDAEEDRQNREEADGLRQLPRADQLWIVAYYREVALGEGVPAGEREAGLRRVAALERLLGIASSGT